MNPMKFFKKSDDGKDKELVLAKLLELACTSDQYFRYEEGTFISKAQSCIERLTKTLSDFKIQNEELKEQSRLKDKRIELLEKFQNEVVTEVDKSVDKAVLDKVEPLKQQLELFKDELKKIQTRLEKPVKGQEVDYDLE